MNPASAQVITGDIRAAAEALRDKALTDSLAYDIVESLTMEVGPRPAGSAGDKAAVRWALAKLEALGFENVRAEPVTVPHWDRGTLNVRITSPFPQLLVATSLGGSSGTPAQGINAEVVRVASLAELRALDDQKLAGRIAYIDHVMEKSNSGRGYGPSSRIRGCGHVVAAEKGAVATIIRSAGTSSHRVAHTGSMLRGGIPGKIPAVALANADADILTYPFASDKPVTVRLHSSARSLPPEQSANVIGEVPGTGPNADEIVVLGAHLDSWDLGTGANDDGTGVAIVTAVAKLIMDSAEAPRRTIRVVLYANEEFGLSGALQYAKDHAESIDKHVVGMEADLGSGKVWKFSSRVADESLDIVNELYTMLEPLEIEHGDNRSSGGADLGPLRQAGMPVLGMSQDATLYFDYHHTADDTLDKVDRAGLNQNVAAYVTATYVAAYMDRDFGRLQPETSDYSCAPEYDR